VHDQIGFAIVSHGSFNTVVNGPNAGRFNIVTYSSDAVPYRIFNSVADGDGALAHRSFNAVANEGSNPHATGKRAGDLRG
jgi:hypothetical protein